MRMNPREVENNNFNLYENNYKIANLNKDEIALLQGYEKDFIKKTNKKYILIAWADNSTMH